MKKILTVFVVPVVLIMLFSQESFGIPAFARKYSTSCLTCHTGFPKVNSFGEAFRRCGYQFPEGTDAEFTKENPVSLGAEGNKKAFPDAVWPGSLPKTSPISLIMNGEVVYDPHTKPAITFDGLGNSIEAVAAGTLGEDLSFWGHAILSSDGTLELNRIFLIFSNIVGDKYALNARVGVFEPGLFSFSTHRAWLEGYWLTTRPFSDEMGWSIEETQKGVELNGVLGGRFGYNAGVVEGYGVVHSYKNYLGHQDFFGHVTYKIAGLPLDGATTEGPNLNKPQPYIDNSLTLGAFVYRGRANIGPDGSQSDGFTLGGGDVNAYYGRFNLLGGVGIRQDEQPFLGAAGVSANTMTWFTELNVVAYPWLLPGVRFESWNSSSLDTATGATGSYTDYQFVPGVEVLIRPNVKATLRTTIEKFDSRGDTKFDLGQFILGLTFGI